MMRVSTLALVVLTIFVLARGSEIRYDGYKVVRVVPQKYEHLLALKALQGQTGHDKVDFWLAPRQVGVPVDMSMSPEVFQRLYASFNLWGIFPTVIIDDVQKLIDAQKYVTYDVEADFDYSQYHTLSEIEAWMKNITDTYSDKASLFEITKSYEARTINGIKISTSTSPDPRPAFWMEGGIHSREWISPATVIYMTGQMLDNYEALKDFVDSYDWYILPVFNVDGYERTWNGDRMWRKTMSVHGICTGVDPNRNWDFHWNENGASSDPCSDTYAGPSAFSEIEVKEVANKIASIANLKGFIDFHSFYQYWMSPWGYTTELPKDFKDMDEGGKAACDALEAVHGTKFEHGSIANIIYVASGSSADWTYGKQDIKYSYGVELRDRGEYGFLLPADQIIPSGEETLQAVIALAKFITNNP
ncbi:carboxypeptidase B-like [Ylistrum balloti]|uniref:carboxypeptidase B-like n=1 Tax=Ylistrum balloti TaxID=509963 RepID=UPI0029059C6E|nr:carboxypeptidase B-like [Ylistrum balloti]